MDRGVEEERIRMETDMLLDKYFPWWRKEELKCFVSIIVTLFIGVGVLIAMKHFGIK